MFLAFIDDTLKMKFKPAETGRLHKDCDSPACGTLIMIASMIA